MRGKQIGSRRLVDLGTRARAVVRGPGTVPSFLVAGTRRGASTSLYQMISEHPTVAPCRLTKGSHYFDVNHHRGWRWFLSCFPIVADGQITGEGSPYYMFHPLAPTRIAAELPQARLIVSLREPAKRAWSHYHFSRAHVLESLGFDEAVDREEQRLSGEVERLLADPSYGAFALRHHSYLARGCYAEQLERLYALIPPEQVLVVQTEALTADPQRQLDRVWRFLNLPPHEISHRAHQKGQRYEPMPIATAMRLGDYFREHNERLYSLPGVDFRWPDPDDPELLRPPLSERPTGQGLCPT